MKRYRVEFFTDRKKKHRWRAVANGRIVAACGEGYASSAMAKKGALSAFRSISAWAMLKRMKR